LGLVFVAWLNLALQPCVMAMELDTDHFCPHCPTEVSSEQHQHGKHDQQQNEAADCSYADTYNHDSRTAESKTRKLSQDMPAIVADILPIRACKFPPNTRDRAETWAAWSSGPPLNILYCVHLK